MGNAVALILALAGSERIPRKNLMDLGRLPLIAHSVRWALAEPGIGQVVVATDLKEIAAGARRGAPPLCPLRSAPPARRRPADLARSGLTPALESVSCAWRTKRTELHPA
jgi:CMP-N-acetylneuraminic acid synthetase